MKFVKKFSFDYFKFKNIEIQFCNRKKKLFSYVFKVFFNSEMENKLSVESVKREFIYWYIWCNNNKVQIIKFFHIFSYNTELSVMSQYFPFTSMYLLIIEKQSFLSNWSEMTIEVWRVDLKLAFRKFNKSSIWLQ